MARSFLSPWMMFAEEEILANMHVCLPMLCIRMIVLHVISQLYFSLDIIISVHVLVNTKWLIIIELLVCWFRKAKTIIATSKKHNNYFKIIISGNFIVLMYKLFYYIKKM